MYKRQFFINVNDNDFLNHGGRDFGYAVFGQVVNGQQVVETIGKVPTGRQGMHSDVPRNPVVINAVRRAASQADSAE